MDIQFLYSLISGVLIGAISGYLGTLMLSRKMSIVAGPLGHLAFPGAALAIVLGYSLFIGVFPFVLLGAVLIWFLEKKTKLPMENLAAIIFAFGMGVALLILPIDKAQAALIGNINNISLVESLVVVVVSIFSFYLTKKMYPKIMLININKDLTTVEGVNVSFYNLIYLLNIALVVSLGVYLVGGLITAALIAIPAATARNFSCNMGSYKVWSVFFGVISTISGIVLNYYFSLPAGPLIILSGVVLFVLSMFFNKN
jgi:ABC-type Mn2+/Zn2+ transport system permease subunit